jgi:ligand-binding SRPBCC domain-containing protein
MRNRVLEREIWLPGSIAEVFAFFSDPMNLEAITPPWLRFRILTPLPVEMKRGTILEYRLRLHGVPIFWRTEISLWEPPHRFVDQQLKGPYHLWVHEHTFEERDGGTLVRDHVDYRSPGWVFEPLLERYFVRPDLAAIFDYRAARLREFFPIGHSGDTRPPDSLLRLGQ